MWNTLKENIYSFSVADRAGLVNDVLVLARSELLDTSIALEFTSFLSEETDYTVWISALSELSYIGTMLSTESDYGLFEEFMQSLLTVVVDYVGWQSDSMDISSSDHNKSLLRASVLNLAVRYNLPSVIETALEKWHAVKQENSFIAPDDRQAIYCAALKYGDATDYQFLFSRLLQTENAAERNRILYSLGCTREFYLLKNTLDISLDSSIVRAQDQRTAIGGVSANPLGRDLAWNFVQANFELFNSIGFSLSSLITIVTSPFNDEFHLKEVETFFNMQEVYGANMAVERAKETISANIEWMRSNSPNVASWLKDNYGNN